MHDIVGYKHGCLEKIIQGFKEEGGGDIGGNCLPFSYLGTAYLTFLLFFKLFLMFVAINGTYVSYFLPPSRS